MASNDDSKRVASTRPASRRGMTKSQIRAERRQRSQSRKKRRRTFYLAGGSLLAIVFILSLTLSPGLGGGHTGGATHTGEGGSLNTGGPVPLDPDRGNAHIAPGVAGTGYATRPATSGPHWFASETPVGVPAPARWGIYDEPLPDEVLVHNLEHGGIGIHYDCPDGCDELIEQLEDLIPRNRAQFILSPYTGIGNGERIALTAWRHHLFTDEFDEELFLDFIDAYQDRAPESVPGNSF